MTPPPSREKQGSTRVQINSCQKMFLFVRKRECYCYCTHKIFKLSSFQDGVKVSYTKTTTKMTPNIHEVV